MQPSSPPLFLEDEKLQPLLEAIESKGAGTFNWQRPGFDHDSMERGVIFVKNLTVQDFGGERRVIKIVFDESSYERDLLERSPQAVRHTWKGTLTLQHFGSEGNSSANWIVAGKYSITVPAGTRGATEYTSPDLIYRLLEAVVELMEIGTKATE